MSYERQMLKVIKFFDNAMTCTLCALIFFLPISIALVETFTGMTVFVFLIKRFYLVITGRDWKSASGFVPKLKAVYALIRPSDTGANKWLGYYVIAVALSCVFSIDPASSWRAMGPKLLERCLLFFAFVEVMTTKERLDHFLRLMFFSVFWVSASGIFQFFTGRDFLRGMPMAEGRMGSAFGNGNDLGMYLITLIPLLIAGLRRFRPAIKEQKKAGGSQKQIIPVAISVVLGMCLIDLGLTFSRGAWLGAAVALIFGVKRFVRQWQVSVLGIVIALLFLLFFGKFARDHLPQSIGQPAPKMNLSIDPSGRQEFWVQAISVIGARPFLGSGFHTYVKAVKMFHPGEIWMDRYYAHNCYLQIAAETGVFSLIAMVSFLYMIFHPSLWTNGAKSAVSEPLLLAAQAGLIAYLTHMMFDTGFYSVQLGTLFWLMCGLCVAAARKAERDG